MEIATRQFGTIQYTKQSVLYFPKGLIGFEELQKFILFDNAEYEPFRWLIAIETQDLALPILNPFLIFPEYARNLPENLVERIFAPEEFVDVYVVVTLKGEGGKVTLNLRSPIIIDHRSKMGEQIILAEDHLSVAEPIL
ncbi:MAG: hypothetical protein D6681_11895 [Calditrichaeota bacterium]|nr:MAG: hypothetical protein D6681_11895 [Calditrichota bacterium]